MADEARRRRQEKLAVEGRRAGDRRNSPSKAGVRLTMAATTTKPAYTVRWKDEENERNLRKLFFAAAADIPDQMLSNLAQPLVRIALKLLELDDVFYLFLQKQKIGAKLHIYL